MIVTKREDRSYDANTTAIATGGITATDPAGDDRDENGMSREEVFDQLEDDDAVVTSGRGSRIPLTDSDGGTTPTGYSSGVGSGSGTD